LPGTLAKFNDTLLDGVPDPPGEGEMWESNPQPKHAVANCSQTVGPMLPSGEYKLGVRWTAILSFDKLLWSLLVLV